MTTRSAGLRFHENVHGVYFDDLDALHILHNSRYLLLVERTIGSFWRRLGMGTALDAEKNPDHLHLVRANAIEYHRPVTDIGEVRVRVWVDKLGHSSLVFGFCVMPLDEDSDYASGTRVVVRVEPSTRKPTPWTPGFRALVAPFVRPAAER